MKTSCTADNLRSPSVAGTNGRDDEDLNTDYAESDVMLGGCGTGTNSNGSNNGNGSNGEADRNSGSNGGHTRY